MQTHGKGQTHMALGSYEQSATISIWAYQSHESVAYIVRQALFVGGLGGGSPSQRGARGAAPARIPEQYYQCAASTAGSAKAAPVKSAKQLKPKSPKISYNVQGTPPRYGGYL